MSKTSEIPEGRPIVSADDWALAVCALREDRNCSAEQFVDAVYKLVEAVRREGSDDLKSRQIPVALARLPLDNLSDDDRLELFSRYCSACGCIQPTGTRCQCANDD